jgi:hypothetical protein
MVRESEGLLTEEVRSPSSARRFGSRGRSKNSESQRFPAFSPEGAPPTSVGRSPTRERVLVPPQALKGRNTERFRDQLQGITNVDHNNILHPKECMAEAPTDR